MHFEQIVRIVQILPAHVHIGLIAISSAAWGVREKGMRLSAVKSEWDSAHVHGFRRHVPYCQRVHGDDTIAHDALFDSGLSGAAG